MLFNDICVNCVIFLTISFIEKSVLGICSDFITLIMFLKLYRVYPQWFALFLLLSGGVFVYLIGGVQFHIVIEKFVESVAVLYGILLRGVIQVLAFFRFFFVFPKLQSLL